MAYVYLKGLISVETMEQVATFYTAAWLPLFGLNPPVTIMPQAFPSERPCQLCLTLEHLAPQQNDVFLSPKIKTTA